MNATAIAAFGLLCAGIGAALTAFPYWRVLDRERSERANADRLRRTLAEPKRVARGANWTEARW